MFSGIVEGVGKVLKGEKHSGGGVRFRIDAGATGEGVAVGESVAVNGCCLTVVEVDGAVLGFDLLEETLQRTNLGTHSPGTFVNLERSLRFDGRIGGHFLTGHVDVVGNIEVLEPRGTDVYLRIGWKGRYGQYIVGKGCVAIDGISLTVVEPEDHSLAVWLIPHTLTVTNLGVRKPGDPVNLEFDLLAKYVERITVFKT